MKYTVTINEKSKTVIVNLNGYEGVAKCCATDTFNLQTGIELALERARVAEANANKPKPTEKPMSVMELVKALEKALPKGEMVIVGNGKELTASQKNWLRSLAGGCDCKCECSEGDYYTEDEIEDIKISAYDEGYEDGKNDVNDRYDEGYEDGRLDGYDEGYDDAINEYEDSIVDENDIERVLKRMREVLADELEV